MTHHRLLSFLVAFAVLATVPVIAADKPASKTDPADPVEKSPKSDAPAKPSASDDKDQLEVIHPNDASAIKERMGKGVAVEGLVSQAVWSNSGKVIQINFAEATETKFMAAAFVKTRAVLDKAFGGDVGKAVSGKRVRVTGKLAEYRGKPEIVIDKPEQLEILADAPVAGDAAKSAEPAKPAEPAKSAKPAPGAESAGAKK